MQKSVFAIFLLILVSETDSQRLFISEYYEDTSGRAAIEIFNPSCWYSLPVFGSFAIHFKCIECSLEIYHPSFAVYSSNPGLSTQIASCCFNLPCRDASLSEFSLALIQNSVPYVWYSSKRYYHCIFSPEPLAK